MLVLSRKPGQKIHVGDNIQITVVRVTGNTVRVGIEAPIDIRILRDELVGREDNKSEPVIEEPVCV